jgi:hypothetical protein
MRSKLLLDLTLIAVVGALGQRASVASQATRTVWTRSLPVLVVAVDKLQARALDMVVRRGFGGEEPLEDRRQRLDRYSLEKRWT